MNVYYSPCYSASGHAFDTTRKGQWVAASLARAPIAGVTLVEPPPLDEALLLRVHAPEYVDAVRDGRPLELAESQGFAWDAGLWQMVLSSNGGAVAAALDALDHGVSGSLSSGLHHAARDHGDGFCTFNGLALAATRALDAGAESVLILDLDAHCGGGTASLIAGEPRIHQLDVSVSGHDRYTSTANATLRMVTHGDEYLGEIEAGLAAVARSGPRHTLCLYNAGMDPFEGCVIGGLQGITREVLAAREELVFGWCRAQEVPIAYVLAGGYVGGRLDTEQLVGLHRITLAEAVMTPKTGLR